jgi:hypothetical protein
VRGRVKYSSYNLSTLPSPPIWFLAVYMSNQKWQDSTVIVLSKPARWGGVTSTLKFSCLFLGKLSVCFEYLNGLKLRLKNKHRFGVTGIYAHDRQSILDRWHACTIDALQFYKFWGTAGTGSIRWFTTRWAMPFCWMLRWLGLIPWLGSRLLLSLTNKNRSWQALRNKLCLRKTEAVWI